ncbi:MAG: hypothetical protein IJ538_03530 [Clostridia bacterium]|nr:hypothetical protein [Clostridia bacterium]
MKIKKGEMMKTKQEEFTKYDLIDRLTKIVGAKLPYTVMEEIIFNEQYNAKYIQGKKYKGFSVFIPKFDGNAVIGEPYEIHAKKGEARVVSSINKDIGKLKIPKEHCDKFTLNHVTLEDEHN